MSRTTPRISFSMRRRVSERLRLLAEARGMPYARVLEELVDAAADEAGIDPDPPWRPKGQTRPGAWGRGYHEF